MTANLGKSLRKSSPPAATHRLLYRCIFLTVCWDRCSGGGEVFLARGQYWLSGPIVVPPGVRVIGEGTQLVSLYFKEATKAEAPKPSYVFSAWQEPPPPPSPSSFADTNATGVLKADASVSACGESGCCVTSALKIAPCNCSDSTSMAFMMDADMSGLVQLRFANCSGQSCCLANINGHSNPSCSAATAWKTQRGYAGNQTLLQTADDRGCLTVSAKQGAKIKPGMELEIDQCWHINKTQNFLVPGIFFPPPLPPPPPPPPHPHPSTTAWGVEGLTIYISHWCKCLLPQRSIPYSWGNYPSRKLTLTYAVADNGVFQASTGGLQHEFFHVRRVRVRGARLDRARTSLAPLVRVR